MEQQQRDVRATLVSNSVAVAVSALLVAIVTAPVLLLILYTGGWVVALAWDLSAGQWPFAPRVTWPQGVAFIGLAAALFLLVMDVHRHVETPVNEAAAAFAGTLATCMQWSFIGFLCWLAFRLG